MAKIDWTFVDEVGTNLNRYIATEGDSGVTYDFFLMRNAEISQVGTSLNASNLNQLISSINTLYDKTSTIDTSINTINSNITTINNKFSSYVPITRTINGKELSSNISITKSDVGLGNVDNTKDSAKIVAQASQLTTTTFFKISDYNQKNSTDTYSFNGTVGFNYILPNSLYLNNLYIANASNDEEYALFRYSNSNKRLEVHSQGAIIFISGSYYANVPNNKSGTLLVDSDLQGVKNSIDTEISDIKNRLNTIESNLVFMDYKDVSGRTSTISDGTGYYYNGSFTIDSAFKVVSVSFSSKVGANENSYINYSGNEISYRLYSSSSNVPVSAKIEYVYKIK